MVACGEIKKDSSLALRRGKMKYPPCAVELKPYCSDILLSMLEAHGKPIPYILKLLDQQCTHRECNHHVLSDSIKFKERGHKHTYNPEAEYVQECNGCMCLVERPASAEEIAKVYDVLVNTIEYCENKTLDKLRSHRVMSDIKEEVRPSKVGGRSYIKRVRGERTRFGRSIEGFELIKEQSRVIRHPMPDYDNSIENEGR